MYLYENKKWIIMKFGLKKEDVIKSEKIEKNDKKNYQEFSFETEDFDNTPRVVNIKTDKKFDVFIGRPSEYGNPFVIGKDGTREEVIEKYENYLLSNENLLNKVKNELKGKVLGCFCYPLACHGDVLFKYANLNLTNKNKNKV